MNMTNVDRFKKEHASGKKVFIDEKLGRADLPGITVENVEFKRCYFVEGVLSRSHWKGVNFEDGSALKANFDNARLERCTIKGFSFRRGSLQKTRFHDCSIEGTDCSESVMDSAEFLDCTIRESLFDDACVPGGKFINSKIIDTGFTDVSAPGSDFTRAEISDLLFADSDLSGCKFVGAIFRNVEFEGCNLAGADFQDAYFVDSNLSEQSGLNEAKFAGARYTVSTRFADDFDPASHGMTEVTDETTEEQPEQPKLVMTPIETPVGMLALREDATAILATCKAVEGEPAPMFDAAVYTTGYYRSDIDPKSARHDWKALGKALKLAAKLDKILEGHYESTSIDTPYYSIVLAPTEEQRETWEKQDPLELLGLSPFLLESLLWTETDLNELDNAFVDEEDFEEEDEPIEEYYDEATLKAYRRATEWMKKNLRDASRYTLLQDPQAETHVTYPTFWLGETDGGIYVGIFTVSADQ